MLLSADIVVDEPDVLPIDTSLEVVEDVESAEVDVALDPSNDQSEVLRQINGRLDGLNADLVALQDGVAEVASADEDSETSSSVVVLDSTQWEEVREAWGWCKAGFSLLLFLSLVCTLLVAALFGNRMWTAFSKGWRS